jgi:ribokinase
MGGTNHAITIEDIHHVFATVPISQPSPHFLVLQNEINRVSDILRRGHEVGFTVVYNPAPMSASLIKDDFPLQLVDILVVNEIEAADLCVQLNTSGHKVDRLFI